jgi:hypothetical protein
VRRNLLVEPDGSKGLGLVHEALHADHAPVVKLKQDRCLRLHLDAAVAAAAAFLLENDHPVAVIDESLGAQPGLIPGLVVLCLERLSDGLDTARDAPF